MKTTTVETSQLSGAALDWAVARATGKEVVIDTVPGKTGFDVMLSASPIIYYSPSTDWIQGGPLIDRFDVGFIRFGNSIVATTDSSDFDYSGFLGGEMHGPNLLIAAMRAIVAAELGGTVRVPAELVEAS